jgi:hypothetical protein
LTGSRAKSYSLWEMTYSNHVLYDIPFEHYLILNVTKPNRYNLSGVSFSLTITPSEFQTTKPNPYHATANFHLTKPNCYNLAGVSSSFTLTPAVSRSSLDRWANGSSHKITTYLYNCCLYGAGCDDFDAGKSITRAIGRGGPLKWKLFWALKWDKRSEWHLGPKKSRFSGPIPSNDPCNGCAPIKEGGGISGTKYIYFARYYSCT